MTNKHLVATWVRRFLLEHVVADLNLSRNTQASYRDALALLLPFAAKQGGQAIDRLELECLSTEVVRRFLAHLEVERHCLVTTRNQRLAAIHAFARFVGARTRAPRVVRRADRHPIQESGEGHAAIPREARDGRGPRGTRPPSGPRSPRPCSAAVSLQRGRPRG